MKGFISLLCVLFGLSIIGLGFYFGLWVMLVGGIVDFINAVKMDPVTAGAIAMSLLKIIFFEIPIIIGFIVGAVVCGAAKE